MTTPPSPRPDPGPGRVALGLLLAVATGLVATTGILSWWVHHTVMDTDRFVEVVEPVATADRTVERIGDQATTRVLAELDLESRITMALAAVDDLVSDNLGDLLGGSLGDLLGGGTDELATSLTADLEGRVTDAIDGAVASPRFRAELLRSVRGSHADLVEVLRTSDDADGSTAAARGDVVVDLEPLVDVAADEAVGDLDGVAGEIAGQVVGDLQVPDDVSRLVLVRSEQLDPWRALVVNLDRGPWVLVAAGLVLGLAAVAIVARWWSPVALGGALLAGAALVGPVLARVRIRLLADVVDPAGRATATEVVDAVIAPVGTTVRLVVVVGLALVALGLAWGARTWRWRRRTA